MIYIPSDYACGSVYSTIDDMIITWVWGAWTPGKVDINELSF
jgi:hypothetical protein